MSGGVAAPLMEPGPQHALSLNCVLIPDFHNQRNRVAQQYLATQVGFSLTPESKNPEAYSIAMGDVLLSYKNTSASRIDQAPYVFSSLSNLVFPVSKLRDFRGETRQERAINLFYSQVWIAGLAKTNVDYVTVMQGLTVNPPVAQRAGVLSTFNYSDVEINAGDTLIACISNDFGWKGTIQGLDRTKLVPQLRPLSRGILFPTVSSIAHSWRVNDVQQLKETTSRLRPWDGAMPRMDRDNEAPMESDLVSRWVGTSDTHTALERFVKVVAMHALDLFCEQLIALAGGRAAVVPPAGAAPLLGPVQAFMDLVLLDKAVLVGLLRPEADQVAKTKVSKVACDAMNQKEWEEGTMFSKGMLRLALGYSEDHCRHKKSSVKTCEMSAYEMLISAFADSVKSTMGRKIGTALTYATPGQKYAVHINI